MRSKTGRRVGHHAERTEKTPGTFFVPESMRLRCIHSVEMGLPLSMASGPVSRQIYRGRIGEKAWPGLASHAAGGGSVVRVRRDLHKLMNIL
jgi:hypothetical protein